MNDPQTDATHMHRCQGLAEAAGRSGNTPVGSLIALGAEILAAASEGVPAGSDPFAHAELVAVRQALGRAGRPLPEGVTLYTTHEPCLLCSFAVREAGIQRVVMAQPTPDIGGVTSRHPILVTTEVARWGPPPVIEWWDEAEQDARR